MTTLPVGYDASGEPIETVTVTATRPAAIPEWAFIVAVLSFLAFVKEFSKK